MTREETLIEHKKVVLARLAKKSIARRKINRKKLLEDASK